MSFKKLTTQGENFITIICNINGNSRTLLDGVFIYKGNKVALPFSSVSDENPPRIWKSNATFNNKTIATNKDLAPALINWFNTYTEMYALDANIIAAQAYQESKYQIWIYNYPTSSASGISQFIMSTAFEIMISNNNYNNILPAFTQEEKDILTNGLTNPYIESSYQPGGGTTQTMLIAKANRTIFHQNLIDHPELCIKAQCRLMKYVGIQNNNIAASALFSYNRGSGYFKPTYAELIEYVKGLKGNDYIQEGLKYVQQIFGYLGDQNNSIISSIKNQKPSGSWFGYSNLNLDKTFDPNLANIDQTNNKFA